MASTVDASRVAEIHEPEAALEQKLDELTRMVQRSGYTVFYTGAGVSTSAGVGDYRGPSGAWTARRIAELKRATQTREVAAELAALLEEQRKEQKKAAEQVGSLDALPTYCHMAQVKMIRSGLAHYVVTTNLDGLYRKAGLAAHEEVCFLHGDIYTERCTACGYDFERNYETRRPRIHVHDHHVGTCDRCGSAPPSGYTGRPVPGAETGADGDGFRDNGLIGTRCKNVGTKDTHINFGECLDNRDWQEAEEHCAKADLCIVMGTSMSLRHITHFPFQAKKTVIINLQRTPDDRKADLRVWATCDRVMSGLFARLGLEIDAIPAWRPKDAVSLAHLRAGVKNICPYYLAAAVRLEEFTAQLEATQRELEQQAVHEQPIPAACRPSAPQASIEIGNTVGPRQKSKTGTCYPWTVYVNDPLEVVSHATFKLHPTFTPSIVDVHERPLSLSRRGWGEFTIGVKVWFVNGSTQTYTHDLDLDKDSATTYALARELYA